MAVRDAGELFVVLWIKRALWRKKQFFVFVPRANAEWDPHTSYHQDGTFHSKSFGRKGLSKKLQPLNRPFRGSEHLGAYHGHGPKTVGGIRRRV